MPAVLRPALTSVTRRTLNSVLARERSISFCRFRTLFRSPACDAVKIRCRRRRTSSSTCRQSIDNQSAVVVLRSVHHGDSRRDCARVRSSSWRPTCPSVPVSSVIDVLTGSPGPRQHPFGSGQPPVSGQLCGTTAEGPATHVPVSCCLSAAGIRFLGHPVPAGEFGLPHGRLTGQRSARTPTGLPRSTRARYDRGGCPLYPGDGGVHPGRRTSTDRRLPLPNGQSLHPAATSHRRGSASRGIIERFTRVHPSGLPLACGPRMERGPLGFSPELRTPPLPATHVRAGTGHGHWPGTTPSTSVEPPISVVHSTRATSCRTESAFPVGAFYAPNRQSLQR